MQFTILSVACLSVTGAVAAPSLSWPRHYSNNTVVNNTTISIPPTNDTIIDNTTTTTPPTNNTSPSRYSGFILPTLLKSHSVVTNENSESLQTTTFRSGTAETSTLYEILVPEGLAGKTCRIVIRAGRLAAENDNDDEDDIDEDDRVEGTQAMDIFNNNIESLSPLQSGNFRNTQLARVRFDASTGLYEFDESVIPSAVKSFPCPAGEVLEWESVAVGTFDVDFISQDFHLNDEGVPNGLSIAYY